MFSSLFCQFWVLTAMPGWGSCPLCPPRWGSDMPGWGCCPICPPPGYALEKSLFLTRYPIPSIFTSFAAGKLYVQD